MSRPPTIHYDVDELKGIVCVVDESLDALESICVAGLDVDITACANALSDRDWRRLKAALPAIPDELDPYIPDDYTVRLLGSRRHRSCHPSAR